jgi:hypothetical protein
MKGRIMVMRKKNIVLYTFIIVALTMVITPIVTAKSNNLLNGDVYIELQWDFDGPGGTQPYSFIGTVSGDIEGDLYITLLEAWFPAPGVEHFTEYWRIEPETGGYIEGENKGKWTMSNFKWIANGEVTGASEKWEHLIGSKWQYGGTTDDPSVGPPNLVTGNGKFHITHNK